MHKSRDVEKEKEIREIFRNKMRDIASLEVIGRNLLVTLRSGVSAINSELREALFQLDRDNVIGGFRVVSDRQIKLLNNWKSSTSVKEATAILKECNESDKKPGRNWCIYEHDSKGEKKKSQGKGWPKTYETKEDGEKALGIMKMFSSADFELGNKGLSKLSVKALSEEEVVEGIIEKLLNLKNPKEVDVIFKEFGLKTFDGVEKLSGKQLNNLWERLK